MRKTPIQPDNISVDAENFQNKSKVTYELIDEKFNAIYLEKFKKKKTKLDVLDI